jgi:hypothetical protein
MSTNILILGGLGVFLIVMGGYVYRTKVREHAMAMAAMGWPLTPGRITASAVAATQLQGSGGDNIQAYVPQVSFSYAVAGTAYQGARISLADLADTSHKKVTEIAARYPVGADVQVSYDAADPKESLLDPSTKGTSPFGINVIALLAAGVVCIVTGFFL